MQESFDPLVPGEVNILGVDTTKGYHIVVANQVAQLVLGSGGSFESPDKKEGGNDQEKRRIPLRDMLGALQGDSAAMGKFVMTMNQISDSSLPSYPIVWSATDIQKAIDGDPVLEKKLEQDMNVRLDGSPTETLRFAAILEGIVIECPVTVSIVKQGKTTKVTGNLREEFAPFYEGFRESDCRGRKTHQRNDANLLHCFGTEVAQRSFKLRKHSQIPGVPNLESADGAIGGIARTTA